MLLPELYGYLNLESTKTSSWIGWICEPVVRLLKS